jgi:hypothetical protein
MKDLQFATLKQATLGNLWWWHDRFMRKGNYAGSRETVASLVRKDYLKFIVDRTTLAVGAKITPRGREIFREWTGQ